MTAVGYPVQNQQYQTTAVVHPAPSQQYYPATAYNLSSGQPYQAPPICMPQSYQPPSVSMPQPNEAYQQTPAFNPAYPPAANVPASNPQLQYYPAPQGHTCKADYCSALVSVAKFTRFTFVLL